MVDATGAVAPHVVIEPDVATPPAGETDRGEVPGGGAEKSPVKPKPATATTVALPKTGDNNWIAASLALSLLGTVLMAAACRC